MSLASRAEHDERAARPQLRELADRVFSRAAAAPPIGGNQVRLLADRPENYPASLAAIRAAEEHVHFESCFIQDDEVGQEFADAFVARAREGVGRGGRHAPRLRRRSNQARQGHGEDS